MNRRKVIKSMGAVTGHMLFPSILDNFLVSCTRNKTENNADIVPYQPIFFTHEQLDTFKEMIDLIIPETSSGSASSAQTHHFIDEVFAKCLSDDQQRFIMEGYVGFANDFQNSNDRFGLLVETDSKAYDDEESHAWFRSVKKYALIGFFTSKEGETKASNYVPVPGDYKGDIKADESTLNYGLTNLHY